MLITIDQATIPYASTRDKKKKREVEWGEGKRERLLSCLQISMKLNIKARRYAELRRVSTDSCLRRIIPLPRRPSTIGRFTHGDRGGIYLSFPSRDSAVGISSGIKFLVTNFVIFSGPRESHGTRRLYTMAASSDTPDHWQQRRLW